MAAFQTITSITQSPKQDLREVLIQYFYDHLNDREDQNAVRKDKIRIFMASHQRVVDDAIRNKSNKVLDDAKIAKIIQDKVEIH